MSFLCNVGNDNIFLYISKMVLDNHILLFVHLRSIFLKAVKQKSCALTPLVDNRYAFKEAHPASNVTWVTLEYRNYIEALISQTWLKFLLLRLFAGTITLVVKKVLRPCTSKNMNNLLKVRKSDIRDFSSLSLINARSIKANANLINKFVLSSKTQILAITETWIKQDTNFNSIVPDGSSFVHRDRKDRIGGGVALVCPEIYETQDHWCTWVFIHGMPISRRGQLKRRCTNVRSIQTPSSRMVDFLDEFADLVDHLASCRRPFLILADFDIHIDTPKKPDTSRFF